MDGAMNGSMHMKSCKLMTGLLGYRHAGSVHFTVYGVYGSTRYAYG